MDKQSHFFAGYGVSITVVLGMLAGGVANMQVAAFAGLLAAALAGVLKEVWDARHPASHTTDLWDAVSTLLGGVLAWGVVTGMAMVVAP